MIRRVWFSGTGRAVLAVPLVFWFGCGGEPQPLTRPSDPAKAREVMKTKMDRPDPKPAHKVR